MLVAGLCALEAGSASAQTLQTGCTPSPMNNTVRFVTTLGDIDVLLCNADVPITVANFLSYVSSGAYTSTGIIHRSVQTGISIVQGGGFWMDGSGVMQPVQTDPPIGVEYMGIANARGTIAMARAGQSATSQWFFNVGDNGNLDMQQFVVFGELVGDPSLAVMDAMAAQTTWPLNPGVLADVPLINYPDDGSSHVPYFIYVTDVVDLPEPAMGAQALAALLALAALRRRRASVSS